MRVWRTYVIKEKWYLKEDMSLEMVTLIDASTLCISAVFIIRSYVTNSFEISRLSMLHTQGLGCACDPHVLVILSLFGYKTIMYVVFQIKLAGSVHIVALKSFSGWWAGLSIHLRV